MRGAPARGVFPCMSRACGLMKPATWSSASTTKTAARWCRSNPESHRLRAGAASRSGEIFTGSPRRPSAPIRRGTFYLFARDRAFLDVCVHQGNDFQITTPFWEHLNDLSREFNEDHRFVVFPGWEWSGNTGLGGDRNVLMMQEGRPIHRSSHALVDDLSDIDSDANSAGAAVRCPEGRGLRGVRPHRRPLC